MNQIAPTPGQVATDQIIKLACMAVGGQGGGVLTGWIETLARMQGWQVQATSVAGVAQRTGATIYYIEMARGDGQPVFALAPSAGDVDVLIAAEMMEAGRAVQRGFVTPDRTTLIASTHRALAVSEKMVPGNGLADSDAVLAAAEIAASRLVAADMEHLAVREGSVISASLFGALAGSGVLPFSKDAFERAISAGGKGVDASLRAFEAGYDVATGTAPVVRNEDDQVSSDPNSDTVDDDLLRQISHWPRPVREMAVAGIRKLQKFQSKQYAQEYLTLVTEFVDFDDAEPDFSLAVAAAKYIANAMCYDDIIRVADLKIRAERDKRIRAELDLDPATVLHVTEYFHPRAEELVSLLPARLGAKLEDSPKWMRRIDWLVNRGRRLRSDGLFGFLMLYFLGGLQSYRLRTRRHQVEKAHLHAWLSDVRRAMRVNPDLAVQMLRCRRLNKGYSDTHARGLSKFDRVMETLREIEHRPDAAEWGERLIAAALQDEVGVALDGAIQTIKSF